MTFPYAILHKKGTPASWHRAQAANNVKHIKVISQHSFDGHHTNSTPAPGTTRGQSLGLKNPHIRVLQGGPAAGTPAAHR